MTNFGEFAVWAPAVIWWRCVVYSTLGSVGTFVQLPQSRCHIESVGFVVEGMIL